MTNQSLIEREVLEANREPIAFSARPESEWPRTPTEFATLVEEYQDRLVRFAFRKLRHRSDAEDVVQDVFVRAYTRQEKSRKIKHVSSYLYRMTANACTDMIRKRKHKPLSLDQIAVESIADERKSAADDIKALEELQRIEEHRRL